MWRGEAELGLAGALIVVAVTACVGAAQPGSAPSETSTSPTGAHITTTTRIDVTTDSPATTTDRTGCELPAGQPFLEGDIVDLVELGEVEGARVRGAVYPHPDYEGRPWSQWGQGMVAGNGRFYSAIGDHLAEDGNSYLYEYDPENGRLAMVGDVLSYVDHVPGTWGYGKIHSQMVPGPCGEIYFSTYWGSSRDIEFEGNYTGDIIFRLDPFDRTLNPLEVPVEFHGQASLAASPDFGLVYGEAIDPVARNADGVSQGPFFAYDVEAGELVFTGPDEPHVGYRSILVDAAGVGYYSIGNQTLQRYDPATGDSDVHDSRLPGEWLRAVTDLAPDGSVYGVTREPDRFFVMHSDGSIESLGDALGYTASIALSPDGTSFYYMPGAHGNSAEWGSPLIRVDTETGDQSVVVELAQLVRRELGYVVGGTYNVAVCADGRTIFMGVNVGEPGSDQTFGEVALLVIELG